MGINDFKLKWAVSKSRGKPKFISSNKMLVAHDFFMKTFPYSGCPITHQFEPALLIGSFCTLPELGIIAVSERNKKGGIHILQYPEMSKLSTLKEDPTRESFEMVFIGLEFLLLVSFKSEFQFELWRWTTGKKMYSLSVPLLNSEIPHLDLKVNPLWWHQAVLQSNVRLILLEMKGSGDQYHFDLSYYFIEVDKGEIYLRRITSLNLKQNSIEAKHSLPGSVFQCCCWMPENKVIVASSSGIFKADLHNVTLQELSANVPSITSMVLSMSGLYVVHKTGVIDIIDFEKDDWLKKDSIDTSQSLDYASLSPDCKFIAVTTPVESIVILEISSGLLSTKILRGAGLNKIIGVGILGLVPNYCVIAEKNGSLHILQEADGSIISTLRIEEDISSLATSPLCSYVLIGSNLGFLYFIDCTNPQKPRIVLCERPYDTPIYHLKFDNYGRYAVTSTQNHVIKIWNAVPSSGFAMLGSKKVVAEIKDFAIFCTKLTDSTFIFILTENDSDRDKSILIRLQLPADFHANYKRYQTDLFGSLSKAALHVQRVTLNNPYTKIEVHRNFGALFHCPVNGTIQKCNAWLDFEKGEQRDVLTIKNASNWTTSLNQHWLAIGNDNGGIYLYSTNNFNKSVSFGRYTASECISESYLNFSLFSNNLICVRSSKDLIYYRWRENTSCLQSIPEWLVYCYSKFESENDYLLSMEEEEQVDILPLNHQTWTDSDVGMDKEFDTLEVCISIINFKMDQFDDSQLERKISSGEFAIDYDCIPLLSLENRKSILQIMQQNLPVDIKENLERSSNDKVKRVSSINVGLFADSYSRSSIDSDIKQIDNLQFPGLDTANNSKTSHVKCNSTLSKSVKCKCKEERISVVKSLMREMCDLKIVFNLEFDAVYDSREGISNSVERSYFEAKMLSQSLPSKAERDFWMASVSSSSTLFDLETDSESVISSESSKDAIAETKRSIIQQLQSSSKIQETFGSSVDDLRLKKRYCDYNILHHEIKIYIILLLEGIEDDFSRWKHDLEDKIITFETFIDEIRSLLHDISLIEADVKERFVELQTAERKLSKKREDKCLKMNLPEKAVNLLNKQIPVTPAYFSQNPFFESSLATNGEDIPAMLEEVDSQNQCPQTVPKSLWEKMCNQQRIVLILGTLLKHLKNQIIFVTDMKHSCYDYSLKLQENVNTIRQALKCISMLVSNFTVKFESLLTMLDEKSLCQNLSIKGKAHLNSLPKQGHQLWTEIAQKSLIMLVVNQQLHEIGELFGRLRKWNVDRSSKNNIDQDEHLKFTKHMRKRLEEVKHAYVTTKSAREEYGDKRKNSAMKILKSLF